MPPGIREKITYRRPNSVFFRGRVITSRVRRLKDSKSAAFHKCDIFHQPPIELYTYIANVKFLLTKHFTLFCFEVYKLFIFKI